MSKDRHPISVLTLLRFYLVHTRDLELLRRKEKKEKVVVALKHVLSESKGLWTLLSPRAYKILLGAVY